MSLMTWAGSSPAVASARSGIELPALVAAAGERASWRFLEFFSATISNANTRAVYYRAVTRLLNACETAGFTDLSSIRAFHISEYFERLGRVLSATTVKQHLAAVRKFFDWMATGGLLDSNPAAPVHGPKVVVRKGKTPVLDADQTRALLDSPSLTNITGLRGRALIGTMLYTFGRVSAVVGMDVEDYFLDGRRWTFRLHEKGGKFQTVPAHHAIVDCLGDYLDASGLADQPKAPLFQSVGPKRQLTGRRLLRQNAWHVIKRRALQASLPLTTRCHTMRATGITNYLQNGGNLEFARALAAHESSQTTRLYDHSDDDLSLDEIERIRF